MVNDHILDDNLLPPDALDKIRLGMSVSESPDLARLGLRESHFRLTLGEIARCVFELGGCLSYGGHLHPDGYTSFLIEEVANYRRQNVDPGNEYTEIPLHVYLAWQEHRKLSISDLKAGKNAYAMYGKIFYLNPDGNPIADPFHARAEGPDPEKDPDVCKQSLTAMRHYMAQHTQGRIFLGGKREGFTGYLPGLVEETLIALEFRQPVYLAGGFGGITLDIVEALGIDDGSWLPKKLNAPTPDPRLLTGLKMLADLRNRGDWEGLQNGLSDDENKKLAASHRPSEIAVLISVGLGRRYFKKN